MHEAVDGAGELLGGLREPLHRLAQQRPGLGQPAAHRRVRDSHDLGDLGRVHALPVEQLETHLVLEREPAQGREEQPLLAAVADHRGGSGCEVDHGVDLGIDIPPASELAGVVAQDVAGDAQHERAKGQPLADAVAALDQQQEGLLDQIAGSDADLVLEEARDDVGVAIVELGARVEIAAPPRLEQPDVDGPVAGHW